MLSWDEIHEILVKRYPRMCSWKDMTVARIKIELSDYLKPARDCEKTWERHILAWTTISRATYFTDCKAPMRPSELKIATRMLEQARTRVRD